jgi:hypothetical protein
MKRSVPLAIMLLVPTFLLQSGSTGRAEVFVLTGGGQIEGTLLNPGQEPRTRFDIKLDGGATLTLSPDRVEQVVEKSGIRRKYEEFLSNLPDTADAHWDMAERCLQAGLKPERTFHLERVLKHAPDHEAARHALGYSQVDGRWVTTEDFHRNQGYTRYRGDWRLEQEVQLMRDEDDRDQEVNEWKRKVKMWRSWIAKGRGKEGEAVAEIRAIDRRRAAPALAELLEDDEEDPRIKPLYIEVLAKLKSQVAVSAFINRALKDPNSVIRDRCLDELTKFGAESASQAFIKALKDNDNVIVNRAATGLGRLRDEDATKPLIDALSTKHRQTVSTGSGNIGVGFNNGGVGGLSAGGGGPKTIEREVNNQAALSALTVIHQNVNFAFDKTRWRNWYAEQNTPQTVNLHRLD